jgi:shikimate kinase
MRFGTDRYTLKGVRQNQTFSINIATPEHVEARIKDGPARGIVGLKTRSLKEIYEERAPLYTRYADVIVAAGEKSQEQIADEIVAHYLQPG